MLSPSPVEFLTGISRVGLFLSLIFSAYGLIHQRQWAFLLSYIQFPFRLGFLAFSFGLPVHLWYYLDVHLDIWRYQSNVLVVLYGLEIARFLVTVVLHLCFRESLIHQPSISATTPIWLSAALYAAMGGWFCLYFHRFAVYGGEVATGDFQYGWPFRYGFDQNDVMGEVLYTLAGFNFFAFAANLLIGIITGGIVGWTITQFLRGKNGN